MKAYRALHRFDEGAPFRPWLLRIVANEAKNRVRASVRRSQAELRLAGLAPQQGRPTEEEALATQDRCLLLEAVQRLPEPSVRFSSKTATWGECQPTTTQRLFS